MLERLEEEGPLSLAIVFGLLSIPWTYGFLTADIPLWPAFIGSATYFAAGRGRSGLIRGVASNLVGVAYGFATLWIVTAIGGAILILSLIVGLCMFLVTLHASLPFISYTPGGFLGYATLFSVHAAERTILVSGLPGEMVATAVAIAIGAIIGIGADVVSRRPA